MINKIKNLSHKIKENYLRLLMYSFFIVLSCIFVWSIGLLIKQSINRRLSYKFLKDQAEFVVMTDRAERIEFCREKFEILHSPTFKTVWGIYLIDELEKEKDVNSVLFYINEINKIKPSVFYVKNFLKIKEAFIFMNDSNLKDLKKAEGILLSFSKNDPFYLKSLELLTYLYVEQDNNLKAERVAGSVVSNKNVTEAMSNRMSIILDMINFSN